MKYKGKINHPKDLVTKEFVENYVDNKLNEASNVEKKPEKVDYKIEDENLYIGGKYG